jgi:hypothetical protein
MVAEAVTDRFATRQVQDVSREFADLVEDRELLGLGFIAVATATGVALAQQIVDTLVPRLPDDLGLRADPSRARDFLAAGLVEGLWAFTVGFVAVKFIGSGRPFLFATAVGLSIGGFAIAGANLIEWGQRVFGMASAELSDAGVDLPDVSGSSASQRRSAPADTAAGGSQPVATDGGLDVELRDPHSSARAGGQPAVAV